MSTNAETVPVWVRSSQIEWEELNGEALLVEPTTGARWLMNATALALWKLCDGQHCIQEMAHALARSRAEVSRFCGDVQRLGLLTPAMAGARSVSPVAAYHGFYALPMIRVLGAGNGSRRRPSPRGISGPG